MSAAVAQDAEALEQIDVCDAWFEYLDVTRNVRAKYADIEPWAWARLQQRLRSVRAKRAHRVRKAAN